jgi:hypothetical protein
MKRKAKPTHFACLTTGWRCVAVTKVGRKWVHLKETGTGKGLRLSLRAWEDTRKRDIVRGKLSPAVTE